MSVTFEIKHTIKIIATYENGWSKELNIISWNEDEPKFDIRNWNEDHTRMTRGITLNISEAKQLKDGLSEIFKFIYG